MEQRKKKKKGFKKSEQSKYRGHYCCAVNCHNNEGMEGISFYRVIRKNKIQQEKWIQKIKRVNEDGTPWRPTKGTKLCGAHFISGNISNEPSNPDFVPTKFPTGHVKEKTETEVSRAKRVCTLFITSISTLEISRHQIFTTCVTSSSSSDPSSKMPSYG